MTALKNMTIEDEARHFAEQCAALAALPCTAETAPKFRALQAEEVKLRKRLDETRKTEKEPHLRASQAVDAKYQPLIHLAQEAVKAVTAALTKFLQAEEARVRAEAEAKRKQAEEEERRARELAAQAEKEEDPFDAFDKTEEARKAEAQAAALTRQVAEPVKAKVVNAEGGRSGGLRTVGYIVTVEDPSALIAHYADRQEFLDLAISMAKREAAATKGQCKVPGVKITADRRAA